MTILTYVDRDRPPVVRGRLRAAIESLEQTSYDGPVTIVDDGSNCPVHLDYIDGLARTGRYDVLRRSSNGGISRAKNTCLRVIAQRDVDVGFLVEDDILFHDGWDRAYVEAMKRSGIEHFSWYERNAGDQVIACNDCLVTATSGLLGLLMTITRGTLTRIGGFKVLPHRYGYEHVQWTYRAILAGFAPFPADIANSSRYIERNSLPSSVDDADRDAGTRLNHDSGYVIDRLLEPLEE